MKSIILAAGTLLLGTSALAWAPSTPPVAHSDKVIVAVPAGDKAPPAKLVAKSNDLPKIAKAEAASASWIADDQTLAETTPQPAATNYPPCRPGPGDDHCIQLYEPGVRAALASWNPPADTVLAAELGGPGTDAGAYTGMGGPEEEALAMNGDGAVDAALGETAADEGADAASYTGVGGPLEEVATTDYPPCRPGPGDDRCIQLYERGVTGR